MNGDHRDLDPLAEDAAKILADLLSSDLCAAVDDAATLGLKKVEAGLERHSDDINAATRRISVLVDSLGDMIRAKADAAIGIGVKKQVLPAFEQEANRLMGLLEHRFVSTLERVERLMIATAACVTEGETRLNALTKERADALSLSIAAHQQSLQDTLSGVEGQVFEKIGEASDRTVDQLQRSTNMFAIQLRDVRAVSQKTSEEFVAMFSAAKRELIEAIAESHSRLSTATDSYISRSTEVLMQRSDDLNAKVSSLIRDATTSTMVAVREAEERVVLHFAAQHDSLRKLVRYSMLGTIMLLLGILTAVLIGHH